ncbi:MAG TPA: AbrB family transcriptional regulator [Rubrobacteraceae bacterium]|nr:AbrB family transcriptional regulator [Rubrobacteraceae bacterium]
MCSRLIPYGRSFYSACPPLSRAEGDARISLALAVAAAVVFGVVGALLGHRLPVPAGVLVGTLAGAGVVAGGGTALLGLPQLSVPSWMNGLLQILLGMMVGFRMTRDSLRSGAHVLAPAALLAAVLILTSVVSALVVAPLASLDVATALFAAAPGGMTEMSTVSASFGADGAAVTAVQLVRVLLAVAIANVLLARLRSKGESESTESGELKEEEQQEEDVSEEGSGYGENLKRLGWAVPWGSAGGIVGIMSGAPAGGIVGALACSAGYRLLTGRPVPVKGFQLGVQALAGGAIGLGVSGEFFGQLFRLAGAGALILAVQMLLWLLTGWLLLKIFGFDLPTAALASSPGGMSEIVSTANQGGADVVIVTFVHLVRLSSIVVVVPLLVALLFGR